MQRVFASKKLAIDALQQYADDRQTPCVVYQSTYGRDGVEYTIRPVSDIIDLSSPRVIATTVHVPRTGKVKIDLDKYIPELPQP